MTCVNSFPEQALYDPGRYDLGTWMGGRLVPSHSQSLLTQCIVWAPHARSVALRAEGHSYPLRRNRETWVGIIPSLDKSVEYHFIIETNRGIFHERGDPYAQWFTLRPHLRPVLIHSSFFWKDESWMSRRTKLNHQPLNIYKVHIPSWGRSPFKSYVEHVHEWIRHCVQMHYTHVEFLPLTEHPLDGSWGYQPIGYFAPTSRHGSPDELKTCIDLLHRAGIGVIFDWVPAHFPKDERGLGRFDGTPLYELDLDREQTKWNTYTFDYAHPVVTNFLISSAHFWIDEFHVDGIRFDSLEAILEPHYASHDSSHAFPSSSGTPSTTPASIQGEAAGIQFIQRLNQILRELHPDVWIIAEDATRYTSTTRPTTCKDGLGFDAKWKVGWSYDVLEALNKQEEERWHAFHHIASYMLQEKHVLALSHDEVNKQSLWSQMPHPREEHLLLLCALQVLCVGKSLMFMGNDQGTQDTWRYDLCLHDSPKSIRVMQWVQALNTLYQQRSCLWKQSWEWQSIPFPLIGYRRGALLCLHNVSSTVEREVDRRMKQQYFPHQEHAHLLLASPSATLLKGSLEKKGEKRGIFRPGERLIIPPLGTLVVDMNPS